MSQSVNWVVYSSMEGYDVDVLIECRDEFMQRQWFKLTYLMLRNEEAVMDYYDCLRGNDHRDLLNSTQRLQYLLNQGDFRRAAEAQHIKVALLMLWYLSYPVLAWFSHPWGLSSPEMKLYVAWNPCKLWSNKEKVPTDFNASGLCSLQGDVRGSPCCFFSRKKGKNGDRTSKIKSTLTSTLERDSVSGIDEGLVEDVWVKSLCVSSAGRGLFSCSSCWVW